VGVGGGGGGGGGMAACSKKERVFHGEKGVNGRCQMRKGGRDRKKE